MKRLFSLLLLGCGGPEALRDPLTVQVKAVPTTPRVERPLPPLYVPADGDAVNFELANDARGMVVSGERIVVRGSDFRHVPNAWDVQLSGGIEIPRTLGGGYLFFSKTALFRAGTFDGPTEPWLFFLHELESIQVGQGFVLAQADGGHRYAFDLGTGVRVAPKPNGAVEVALGRDGTGFLVTERARVLVQSGDALRDVTDELPERPSELLAGAFAWADFQSRTSVRVKGGALEHFAKRAPVSRAVREKPKRFGLSGMPLRVALLDGRPAGAGRAAVMGDGQLYEVDLSTGDVLSATAKGFTGQECEALKAYGEWIFVCTGKTGSAIFSHTGDPEHVFGRAGTFFAGEEGALAFLGPCTRETSDSAVCVRTREGMYVEYKFSAPPDPNPAPAPRGKGPPHPSAPLGVIPVGSVAYVLFVRGKAPVLVNAETGDVLAWPPMGVGTPLRLSEYDWRPHGGAKIVKAWGFARGRFQVWSRNHPFGLYEVGLDGVVTEPTRTFESLCSSGAYALATSKGGHLFQTLDRGASFVEVEPPPGGTAGGRIVSCGTLGAELFGYYRLGFREGAPKGGAPEKKDFELPLADVSTRPALSLDTAGIPKLVRRAVTPGLGMSRFSPAVQRSNAVETLGPFLSAPIRNVDQPPEPVRIMLGGAGSTKELHYVLPFDESARVRSGSLFVEEGPDGQASPSVIPVTPLDPESPSRLLVAAPPLLTFFSGDKTVRFKMPPNRGSLAGAVEGANDSFAVLVVESDGEAVVHERDHDTLRRVFSLPPAGVPERYPPNLDALGVAEDGAFAIVRTRSGRDPASAVEPALAFFAGKDPVSLAPFSTATFASDPACTAEPRGIRVTLQTAGPWFSLPESMRTEEASPGFLRVRWNTSRVCIEGIEQRVSPMDFSRAPPVPDAPDEVMTSVVGLARAKSGFACARVGVASGVEYREPLSCSIRR